MYRLVFGVPHGDQNVGMNMGIITPCVFVSFQWVMVSECFKNAIITLTIRYLVSQKKYGVENCNIGAVYQCNILRHSTHDLYLSVCKVSIQYIKRQLKL